MSGTNFEDNNQVDTFEITAIVWSHKLLIAVCVFATVIYAGFLLSGMEKKYTAIAIFRLENPSSNSSIPMSEEIGAIAAIAGIKGMGSDSTDILLERMSNKEFILNVSKELSLKNDKYFNTYEPPGLESWWKAKLKSFIGKAKIISSHSFNKFRLQLTKFASFLSLAFCSLNSLFAIP